MIFTMALTMNFSALAVTTEFTKNASNGGAPVVEVKWEMNNDRDCGDACYTGGYLGTDDYPDAGAQFDPSGQFGVDKTIAVCAIVSDPDGIANIDRVASFMYYPEGIYLGDGHVTGRQGCGEQMGTEFELSVLGKDEGIALFCDRIQNNNNNLPEWAATGEAYARLCSDTTDDQRGMLRKDTAKVYCGEKTISYEDPDGEYRVRVKAQDTGGMIGTLDNFFTYVEMTAYDVDFTTVNYGPVTLNVRKDISGDNDFGTSAYPTVRNVGNTRLKMQVSQDDMGLGQMGTDWNVRYYARVGDLVPTQEYLPNEWITLEDSLDLSAKNEMDFSILVKQFMPDQCEYRGTMTLDAVKDAHLTDCP